MIDALEVPAEALLLSIALADGGRPCSALIMVNKQPGLIDDAPMLAVPVSGPTATKL